MFWLRNKKIKLSLRTLNWSPDRANFFRIFNNSSSLPQFNYTCVISIALIYIAVMANFCFRNIAANIIWILIDIFFKITCSTTRRLKSVFWFIHIYGSNSNPKPSLCPPWLIFLPSIRDETVILTPARRNTLHKSHTHCLKGVSKP